MTTNIQEYGDVTVALESLIEDVRSGEYYPIKLAMKIDDHSYIDYDYGGNPYVVPGDIVKTVTIKLIKEK